MGGGVVLADTFSSAGGGVEEGQVVGHSGPHAGYDDSKEEAEEAMGVRNGVRGEGRGGVLEIP